MKKLKFILPMLAFVLAIGMSFAFTNKPAVVSGYYEISPGNRVQISNVNCPDGSFNCTVQFVNKNGVAQSPEYVVYPTATGGNPLLSNANEPYLIVID